MPTTTQPPNGVSLSNNYGSSAISLGQREAVSIFVVADNVDSVTLRVKGRYNTEVFYPLTQLLDDPEATSINRGISMMLPQGAWTVTLIARNSQTDTYLGSPEVTLVQHLAITHIPRESAFGLLRFGLNSATPFPSPAETLQLKIWVPMSGYSEFNNTQVDDVDVTAVVGTAFGLDWTGQHFAGQGPNTGIASPVNTAPNPNLGRSELGFIYTVNCALSPGATRVEFQLRLNWEMPSSTSYYTTTYTQPPVENFRPVVYDIVRGGQPAGVPPFTLNALLWVPRLLNRFPLVFTKALSGGTFNFPPIVLGKPMYYLVELDNTNDVLISTRGGLVAGQYAPGIDNRSPQIGVCEVNSGKVVIENYSQLNTVDEFLRATLSRNMSSEPHRRFFMVVVYFDPEDSFSALSNFDVGSSGQNIGSEEFYAAGGFISPLTIDGGYIKFTKTPAS